MVFEFLSEGGRQALPVYEMNPKEEKIKVGVFCQLIFLSHSCNGLGMLFINLVFPLKLLQNMCRLVTPSSHPLSPAVAWRGELEAVLV